MPCLRARPGAEAPRAGEIDYAVCLAEEELRRIQDERDAIRQQAMAFHGPGGRQQHPGDMPETPAWGPEPALPTFGAEGSLHQFIGELLRPLGSTFAALRPLPLLPRRSFPSLVLDGIISRPLMLIVLPMQSETSRRQRTTGSTTGRSTTIGSRERQEEEQEEEEAAALAAGGASIWAGGTEGSSEPRSRSFRYISWLPGLSEHCHQSPVGAAPLEEPRSLGALERTGRDKTSLAACLPDGLLATREVLRRTQWGTRRRRPRGCAEHTETQRRISAAGELCPPPPPPLLSVAAQRKKGEGCYVLLSFAFPSAAHCCHPPPLSALPLPIIPSRTPLRPEPLTTAALPRRIT